MGITSNKDLNELARKAIRLGWRVFVTGRSHIRWIPPDEIQVKYGHPYVTTSLTPSNNYAINMIERDLRKAGLFHEEETLAKAKLAQTKEEKFLDLGTSLPIPVKNPTLADVAPPEVLSIIQPQEEKQVAKAKRVYRPEMRAEILKVLHASATPMTAEQILKEIPKEYLKGADIYDVHRMVGAMGRNDSTIVRTVSRGLYSIGSKYVAPQPTAAPAKVNGNHVASALGDSPDIAGILDRAVSVIAELEKVVQYVKERDAAMSAVRKLLGGV